MKNRFMFTLMLIVSITTLFSFNEASARSVQDVFIFCQDELDPGAKASFRVVVKEAKSLTESVPVKGALVEVNLVSDSKNRRIIKSLTGSDGTLSNTITVPDLSPGKYELQVKVSSKLGVTEKSNTVTLKPRYKILLSSDKPLYQPGQIIHIRAVSLKLADLKPVPKTKVVLEVEDPQGNKVFKKIEKTDSFGIFSADFQLADEIKMGEYRIRAIVGEREAEKVVTVKRYVLPKFKIELDTDKTHYRPGEKVKGTVDAQYFFGKPVDGGKVVINAQAFDFEFHTVAEVTGKTDKDGKFEFEMDLPDYFAGQPLEKGDAFIKIEAKVTDGAKHSEIKVTERKVSAADLKLEIVPEAGIVIPGVENKIYAVVVSPDDSPVIATVKIKIGEQELTAKTDDTGIAEFSVTPKDADFRSIGSAANPWDFNPMNQRALYAVDITASAFDKSGREVSVTRQLSSADLKDTVLLRMDKAIYTAGDDIELKVLSTFKTGTTYIDIIKNRKPVLTKSMDIKQGKSFSRIAIPQDLFGTVEVHAYIILPSGHIVRDTRVVYIEQTSDLDISVKLDKDTYRPGEEAKLIFKVTDKYGNGKSSALGVSIVDESVFAIQDMQPGLLKVYFTLEKELAKPRYEVHFAPAGESIESMIQHKREARVKKDKVMRVLLAGVSKPTDMAWEENPAKERIQLEKERMNQFAYGFVNWSLTNQFLKKDKKGEWQYKDGIAEEIVKSGTLTKEYAYDSFGNPYTPDSLRLIASTLDLRTVSDGIASYRLLKVYESLRNYYNSEEKSWLSKLFEGTNIVKFPEDVMDRIIEKEFIEKSLAIDPWGNQYLVEKLDEEIASPYHNMFRFYKISSMGADGKAGTSDDVSDPYFHYNLPVMYNVFNERRWRDQEGMFQVAMDGAGDMLAGGGMMKMATKAIPPMPMAMEMKDEKVKKKNGGSHAGNGKNDKGAVRIREYFPETLYWEPALITDRNGNAEITLPMADSITTWRLSTLGHSAQGYLGSTTSGIRVFQDFFVDIDFPVQLTQGDEVEIPVQVL